MNLRKRRWKRCQPYFLVAFLISLMCINVPEVQAMRTHEKPAENGCALAGPTGRVKHVVQIMFDNVHLSRDNPNIPSDLEQMPNLFNFLKGNGTIFANHHTTLIAHTATGLLTSLTGVYGDRHGVPISNDLQHFHSGSEAAGSARAFEYWTSHISHNGNLPYNMLNEQGKNMPAPWVPYTRAGCNVGVAAAANMALQDPKTEIPRVFGKGSPEEKELLASQTQPEKVDLLKTNYTQIAVHCAAGAQLCSEANHGRADILPDEPGGYTGFSALYGHKYVAPQISPAGPLKDLNGNVIQDRNNNPGFPGSASSMEPSTSLAYTAAMQEHGIPVTYAFIPDAHDNRILKTKPSFKPGEQSYSASLKQFDDAFGKFFERLRQDGITRENTLFAFWADEGDHFVANPLPKNCDGTAVPCTGGYSEMGEVTLNLPGLLATQKGIKTPFTLTPDSAPTIFLNGNPMRNNPQTRIFGRALAGLTVKNPRLGGQEEKVANYLADPVGMRLLHMVTSDPKRTPTLTLFAKPDYFVKGGAQDCAVECVTQATKHAWNHGTVSPDINVTWLGLVGPGVRNLGVTRDIWSDQTDTRPTLLQLLGLHDSYRSDGRVLFEALEPQILPKELQAHYELYGSLARSYKQIYATLGKLGMEVLRISTAAVASDTANDGTYIRLEQQLQEINTLRDLTAGKMIFLLDQGAFGRDAPATNETQIRSLIKEGEELLVRVQALQ
jgi:hypothetical protein